MRVPQAGRFPAASRWRESQQGGSKGSTVACLACQLISLCADLAAVFPSTSVLPGAGSPTWPKVWLLLGFADMAHDSGINCCRRWQCLSFASLGAKLPAIWLPVDVSWSGSKPVPTRPVPAQAIGTALLYPLCGLIPVSLSWFCSHQLLFAPSISPRIDLPLPGEAARKCKVSFIFRVYR